jgi:hypothetical protein
MIVPTIGTPRFSLDALRASPAFNMDLQREQSRMMIERLNAQTERWMRLAIERGPGWSVWRSHPRTPEGNQFAIVHDFALIGPGEEGRGAGWLFTQPELSDGERVRLLAGRYDWQDDRWQDECGVTDCGHDCCEVYRHGR